MFPFARRFRDHLWSIRSSAPGIESGESTWRYHPCRIANLFWRAGDYPKLRAKGGRTATDPVHGVDLGALENALQRFTRVAACLLVTNYSNPLGYSLSTETKRDLVRLLARFGVPLIEDDIFGELHRPETERPKVARSFDQDGSVILIGSFSKILAPGLRVGWIVPGKFRDRVLQLKSATA